MPRHLSALPSRRDDEPVKAVRVVLKHPKVRALRAQTTVCVPGTKPYAFYTRAFGRGVVNDSASGEE